MSTVKLVYRELDDYKYQTKIDVIVRTGIMGVACETEYLRLSPNGMLFIRAGYAWNGSNYTQDEKAMLASLVHDALYQLMRMGLLSRTVFRKPADALYARICILEKTARWRAKFRYHMLQWFGEGSSWPSMVPRGQVKTLIIEGV